MSNRFQWTGVDELRKALLSLPKDLASEASTDVADAANSAKDEIYGAYPDRTGDLRDGLSVQTVASTSAGVGYVVKNSSRLAWIFENGSQARHTALGANRGSMPPGNVFLPVIIRKRREMYEKLRAVLERNGLTVTGTP